MNHKFKLVADIVYTTNNLCNDHGFKTMDSKDIAAKAWATSQLKRCPTKS